MCCHTLNHGSLKYYIQNNLAKCNVSVMYDVSVHIAI